MKQEHYEHLDKLIAEFSILASTKYQQGVKEHGGHLRNMSVNDLLDNAVDEAIDQVGYLLTLKEKNMS